MLEEKQHYLNLMGTPRVDAHRKYLDTVEPATGEARAALPNIVVIMMDDRGWGDWNLYWWITRACRPRCRFFRT